MRAKEFLSELGIGGQFIKGMTGGQATSLGGLAKVGAAKAASGLGLNTTAGNISATIKTDNEIPPEMKNMSTKELVDALGLKVGIVTVIGQQKVKISAINSEGFEGTDLQSHMPVSYPKEALMMMLAQQRQGQQQ